MNVRIWLGLLTLVFFVLAVSFQILLSTKTETTSAQKSLELWFGKLGLVFVWLILCLVIVLVFEAPRILPLLRILISEARQTFQQVRDMTVAIQGLTENLKKSTKISELVQSGVNLASEAARAIGKTQ